ncbi:DUF6429 family protein [Paracoccus marinaquae]|uniref:DUF6429 domain-containing protein n=1 Tax=Paracoccus marinaquae TaxID=2841926 RepID=A0ABS6AMG2_9RHOB|nr:DUF6429 family protein [Paracoccus marinaquae]MBU3030621.1 hypothetical protein [Paracoccus marinaquae]
MTEPDLDTDKLDDAALAILSLTLHDGNRVWKGIDWSITDRLHAKGLIYDPIGKAKSLALTEDGLARAEAALVELFVKRSDDPKRSEQ